MPPPRVCVPDPRMHIWPVCVSHECRSPRSVGGGWVWVWVGGWVCCADDGQSPPAPKTSILTAAVGHLQCRPFPCGCR